MSSNRLKLNADKTQFVWLGPALQLDKVGDVRLRIGGVDISPLDHVRDLGVMLDSLLRYGPHSFRVAAPFVWNNLPRHLRNDDIRLVVNSSLAI